MRKIERLRLEALESCSFRGHKMKRFKRAYNGIAGNCAFTSCMSCGKEVVVCDKPAPNGIDVGGEAVALHCID